MRSKKPEIQGGREESTADNFSMPEWLKNAHGLNHAQEAAVLREFENIAEGERAKRERFSAQFSDRNGWEKVFGNDHPEFDPDSFYVS